MISQNENWPVSTPDKKIRGTQVYALTNLEDICFAHDFN